jgi:hypothetical protein
MTPKFKVGDVVRYASGVKGESDNLVGIICEGPQPCRKEGLPREKQTTWKVFWLLFPKGPLHLYERCSKSLKEDQEGEDQEGVMWVHERALAKCEVREDG